MLEPNLSTSRKKLAIGSVAKFYTVVGNQIKLFQGWVILGEGVVIDISGLEKVRRAGGSSRLEKE